MEGNGQGLLIFLAESHACVGKMEFASACGIIPGANFNRGHPSLPQARTEWVLHAPPKANLGIPGQGAQTASRAWFLAHLWWSSRSLVAALRHCCFLFFFLYPGYNAKPLWYNPQSLGVSLVGQLVKNPPTMQETQVQFLGPEDLPEKEMATHLSGKSLGQRSLEGYSPWGHKSRTWLSD